MNLVKLGGSAEPRKDFRVLQNNVVIKTILPCNKNNQNLLLGYSKRRRNFRKSDFEA